MTTELVPPVVCATVAGEVSGCPMPPGLGCDAEDNPKSAGEYGEEAGMGAPSDWDPVVFGIGGESWGSGETGAERSGGGDTGDAGLADISVPPEVDGLRGAAWFSGDVEGA